MAKIVITIEDGDVRQGTLLNISLDGDIVTSPDVRPTPAQMVCELLVSTAAVLQEHADEIVASGEEDEDEYIVDADYRSVVADGKDTRSLGDILVEPDEDEGSTD